MHNYSTIYILIQSLLYFLQQFAIVLRSVAFRIVRNDVKTHDRGMNYSRILPYLCTAL